MPSIKDFEKSAKHKKSNAHSEDKTKKNTKAVKMAENKRRPSKMNENKKAEFTDIESESIASELSTDHSNIDNSQTDSNQTDSNQTDSNHSDNAHSDNAHSDNAHSDNTHNSYSHFESDDEKIKVQFPGSDLLRFKFGKAFDVIDNVANDWIKDGDFSGVQIGHPLVQVVTVAALKKAKELEKKAQTTQVYSLAMIGLEYAKSKIKSNFKKD